MKTRLFIVFCVFILATALAKAKISFPVRTKHEYVINTVKIPYEKRVIIEKKIPITRPDGYITERECYQLSLGEDFRDVIWRWGWPALDDAEDSYAGYLYYPLREDHNRFCGLDFLGTGKLRYKHVDIS